jgi:KDO2-lipid IV(A) lauroyltransferase
MIGSLAWVFARRQRAHVTANVVQVLGPSVRQSLAGGIRVQLIVRRIFCNCIQNYLELLALPSLTRQNLVATMDVTGVENLEDALSHGRGVVVFSAHLGPFEYMSSWLPARGYETVIPVEKVTDERLLRLTVELRRRTGVVFVPLDGVKAVRTMFGALRRNQIVLITADRAVQGESVVMDFFGAAARLPRGPVDLSLRTGAPLVGGFGWRTPGNRVAVLFTPLTLALPEDQRDKPELLQAALTRQLERIVRDHLDEWVVFESIWANAASRA